MVSGNNKQRRARSVSEITAFSLFPSPPGISSPPKPTTTEKVRIRLGQTKRVQHRSRARVVRLDEASRSTSPPGSPAQTRVVCEAPVAPKPDPKRPSLQLMLNQSEAEAMFWRDGRLYETGLMAPVSQLVDPSLGDIVDANMDAWIDGARRRQLRRIQGLTLGAIVVSASAVSGLILAMLSVFPH